MDTYWDKTAVVMATVLVAQIPPEYVNDRYKWTPMSKRRYILTATRRDIRALKGDARLVVSEEETYRLL